MGEWLKQEQVEQVKKMYPTGTLIELGYMDEKDMPSGIRGEVDFVDDAGHIHMKWENGRSLALVPGVDVFQILPPIIKNTEIIKSREETFIEDINRNILPFIDYGKLQASYDTEEKSYAKGVLNLLHKAFVKVYEGDIVFPKEDDDFALVPGVVQGVNTGKICLALLETDLAASGEHWGSHHLLVYGVCPHDSGSALIQRMRKELYSPYAYGYTPSIPNDIHVKREEIPSAIMEILDAFRSHELELSKVPLADAVEPQEDEMEQ